MAGIQFLIPVLIFFISTCSGSLQKGLYCQDPDTGNLYPINTTWQSTTFCGNYTCKIRKVNLTDMDNAPSNLIINTSKPYSTETNDKNKENYEETNEKPLTVHNLLSNSKNTSGVDRYLSDTEVKHLSEMLRSVKKSDLDAILEMYNIANDIYKELEERKEEDNYIKNVSNNNNNSIEKESDSVSDALNPDTESNDIEHAESNVVQETAELNPAPSIEANYIGNYPQIQYYYSPPNVQRLSSYYYPQSYVNRNVCKPCQHQQQQQQQQHQQYYQQVQQHQQIYQSVPRWSYYPTTPSAPAYYQQKAQPPVLLPLPLAIIRNHNDSSNSNLYQLIHPWAQYKDGTEVKAIDVDKKEKEDKNNTVIVKAEKRESDLAPWQTEPLTQSVLDEVRAYVLENSKPYMFPFKKKRVTVDKVINDEKTRIKRMIDPVEQTLNSFETFIEKTT